MRIRICKFWRRREHGEGGDGGEGDELPPPSRSQRLFVAAAALAVTAVLGIGLIVPHLNFLRHKGEAAQPRPCAQGQTRDCVGGTMNVIVAPAASAAR